ncbi:MAG: TrbI/VirB10 family protein [Burkholderiales bacterium]|nr:TrbI/VirB10 family protein [Burkholderiales bacterium]
MISEKPKSQGLNKTRVLLTLILLGSLSLGTILYFALRNDEPAKLNNTVDNSPNYTARDGSDYSNILDAAKRNASQAVNASSPTGRIMVKTDSSSTVSAMSQNEMEAYRQAMRASLQTNQVQNRNTEISSTGASGSADSKSSDDPSLPKDDQNQQAEKRAFIKANSKANVAVKNRIAENVLALGTKIPAQVDQDINSDLPGQIYGHTTRDVYDSRTNSVLLIPAGSNVVGTYDSSVAYGQERLLVAWTRVNLPNGQFIDLPGFGGADAKGAGFGDQVDNHYDKIWGATILTSILAAGAQLAQPQQSNALQSPGAGQILGQSVGTQIAQTGTTLLNKNLNLQPTLHIRPGFEFTIEVNKDMVFASAYTGNARKN